MSKRIATLSPLVAALCVLAAERPAAAGSWSQASPQAETFVREKFPGNNNGACGFNMVGFDSGSQRIRTFIQFTLPTPSPGLAGRTTVTGVLVDNVVTRTLPSGANGTVETLFLNRLPFAFVQGGGCATQVTQHYADGVACGSAFPFGATWTTSNCSTGWTGGSPVGIDVSSALNGAILSWDSGGSGANCLGQSELCTDVQTFLDAGSSTVGWVIHNPENTVQHVQDLTRSGTLAFNYNCKPGFLDTGTTCTTCTAAARSACVVTCPSTGGTCTSGAASGNTCNDSGPPSTGYTCTCNNPAYTGTGSTACTDFNACAGAPCAAGGDTSAICNDAVAPNTGYSCTCNTGFTYNGSTCVSQCAGASNPCNVNGDSGSSCTVVGTGGWTCACSSGYVSSGGVTPACVNFNACTAGTGNSACVTTCPSTGGTCTAGQPSGNGCNDLAPPSTSFTCVCSNAAYTGTGTTACTDKNECVGNPCAAGGDAAATCTDAVAPNTGHTCTCTAGFIAANQGTSSAGCVDACTPATSGTASDPCLHGTCTVAGTGWSCACQTGYVSTGGTQPTCVDYNACTMGGGNTACITTCPSTGGTCTSGQPSGNLCNDLPPPSLSYTCSCNNGAYTGTGTTSCTDKNACAPNNCGTGGDTGALVACHDAVAPAIGYTCSCDTGFNFNGTTCQSQCSGAANPCNQNGETTSTCTVVGSGGWTCGCTAGFVSTGGMLPTCVNYNACTANANADCSITIPLNACVDEAPPSITYHCTCGNPAYVPGPGLADGGPGCNHIDYCSPNHCRAGGDTGSTCTNSMGVNTGYTCTCSNTTYWTQAVVAGFNTCVDINECAVGNPCGAGLGTCTNVPLGGGYACACGAGYLSTTGPSPHCFHPTTCDPFAQAECVVSKKGNSCAVKPPPSLEHTCTCTAAGYVVSEDGASCIIKPPSCDMNHCADHGDPAGTCVPLAVGYTCKCSPGWKFDGSACVDNDECLGAGNPCGHGTCDNTIGSYTCACENGYVSTGGQAPTCIPNTTPNQVTVVSTAGGCSFAGERTPPSLLLLLLVALPLVLARRRARR
jgi:hypothetical protein